jgi:adenine/guanine/hypoxanthine permease
MGALQGSQGAVVGSRRLECILLFVTNVLLNVIVLTTLCLFVVKGPNEMVFGRIPSALGIALSTGNLYCAYFAYCLARKEERQDVAAMPYGPSVPHMFIVVLS